MFDLVSVAPEYMGGNMFLNEEFATCHINYWLPTVADYTCG